MNENDSENSVIERSEEFPRPDGKSCDVEKPEVDDENEPRQISGSDSGENFEEKSFENREGEIRESAPDFEFNLEYDFAKLRDAKNIAARREFDVGNHARGCKWSPDGLCVLLCSRDQCLRIFEAKRPEEVVWTEVVKSRESGTVYDFCWNPLMRSDDPDSCFFASTAQGQPIHLLDAFDGSLKNTFKIHDQVDEVTTARCLCFSPQGDQIYAGLKNEIRVFRVDNPGRDCDTVKTFSKQDGGLSGIVSALCSNPALSKVYAAGSYGRGVAVYHEQSAVCYLDGQRGGVTHLQFTPDGTKLVVGGRKDPEILIWDMRNPGQLFAVLNRRVETNQRIYFDVDPSGRYLASGSTDGSLTVWNLDAVDNSSTSTPYKLKVAFEKSKIHSDCVNGVSFHPYRPLLATSCGQRHLTSEFVFSSDEDGEEKSEENSKESSLNVWDLSSITSEGSE